MKKVRRTVSLLILVVLIPAGAAALELSGAVHVDTYAGTVTPAFSFEVSERILPYCELSADLQYFTANRYQAQCLIRYSGKRGFVGGGIAYTIDNNVSDVIVPGIGVTGKLLLPFKLGLEGAGVFSLVPANLYKQYGFYMMGKLLFSTEHADSFIQYAVNRNAAEEHTVHTVLFEVEAFTQGVPFKLLLAFGTDFLTETTANSAKMSLELYGKGGFSIITEKAGTYFLRGQVTPLTYRAVSTPFEIAAGIELTLNER